MRWKSYSVILLSIFLSGCITVYGPYKPGEGQGTQTGSTTPGMSEGITTTKIGNRNPNELMNATTLFFNEKGLENIAGLSDVGVVSASGENLDISELYLDCSEINQTQNIQEQYRVVAQFWSAGEGTNVSIQVTGTAGLVTADGNDKIKPVECKSKGVLERVLLERLRK